MNPRGDCALGLANVTPGFTAFVTIFYIQKSSHYCISQPTHKCLMTAIQIPSIRKSLVYCRHSFGTEKFCIIVRFRVKTTFCASFES